VRLTLKDHFMSFRSVEAKPVVLRPAIIAGAVLVAVGLIQAPHLRAQSVQRAALPKVGLPDEAAGIDGIVGALVSVYDRFDVVALGESHERKVESDLRVALVRHPDFAKKVQTIVVEFASTTEQGTLDRYIRGEDVARAQFERVWKNTSQFGKLVSDHPFYTDLFTAVREVNSTLPADARIRVFGGDTGPGEPSSREALAVSILKEQALRKRGKALVIYGATHFYRAMPQEMLSRSPADAMGIVRMLEMAYPGRTFTMIPVGSQRKLPGSVNPGNQKFDRALKTRVRPVMVPLQRLPFRDFTAEEFLGGDVCIVVPGGCRSPFKGSTLTLGQMADAAFYDVGGR
jgi:hypothetical protein